MKTIIKKSDLVYKQGYITLNGQAVTVAGIDELLDLSDSLAKARIEKAKHDIKRKFEYDILEVDTRMPGDYVDTIKVDRKPSPATDQKNKDDALLAIEHKAAIAEGNAEKLLRQLPAACRFVADDECVITGEPAEHPVWLLHSNPLEMSKETLVAWAVELGSIVVELPADAVRRLEGKPKFKAKGEWTKNPGMDTDGDGFNVDEAIIKALISGNKVNWV